MKSRLLVALLVLISATSVLAAATREATIPAGTVLRVSLEDGVGSDTSRIEDRVRGHLVNPIAIDGRTVVPAGSRLLGTVAAAMPAGKVKGRARLAMRFNSLTLTNTHERYHIKTRTWFALAPGTKEKDAATIALPTVGGAIVGGLIDGKKGAAIGSVAGAGAGTAAVLSTRGKEVRFGPGAVLLVRLASPLTVTTR